MASQSKKANVKSIQVNGEKKPKLQLFQTKIDEKTIDKSTFQRFHSVRTNTWKPKKPFGVCFCSDCFVAAYVCI